MWDVLKEYPAARIRLEAIAVKRLEKYKKAPLEKGKNLFKRCLILRLERRWVSSTVRVTAIFNRRAGRILERLKRKCKCFKPARIASNRTRTRNISFGLPRNSGNEFARAARWKRVENRCSISSILRLLVTFSSEVCQLTNDVKTIVQFRYNWRITQRRSVQRFESVEVNREHLPARHAIDARDLNCWLANVRFRSGLRGSLSGIAVDSRVCDTVSEAPCTFADSIHWTRYSND